MALYHTMCVFHNITTDIPMCQCDAMYVVHTISRAELEFSQTKQIR